MKKIPALLLNCLPMFLSCSVLIVLFFNALHRSAPIPEGKAGNYWAYACGVDTHEFDLRRTDPSWRAIFPAREGWYFYYFQEHHGRHVHKVRKEELLKKVPEVFAHLRKESPKRIKSAKEISMREQMMGKLRAKYRKTCAAVMLSTGNNPDAFLKAVNALATQSPYADSFWHDIGSFDRQWRRAQRYWITVLFEAIFLSFWWMFTFHKGIFGTLNARRDVQIGFSPLVLFLPYYLGYAPFLYSSAFSGGILYPLFALLFSIFFSWIPMNALDIAIIQALPKPLVHISQMPASPMALYSGQGISPTALVLFAVLIIAASKLLTHISEKEMFNG